MSRVVELLYSRRVPQVAALALMSFGFAGCSADMPTPLVAKLTSPIPLRSQPEATGSVPTPDGRAPRAAAIFPPAAAIPVTAVAAADRRAAVLSGRATPACPEEGAGVSSYAPPHAVRRSRPPAPSRRARSPPTRTRRRRPAPRSSSAPATRWTRCRAATTFPPPRSCRPTATRGRARCRLASN